MTTATELHVKASQMRDRADQQSDAGAAAAYRSMAEHYEAIALLQDIHDGPPVIVDPAARPDAAYNRKPVATAAHAATAN